MPAPLAAADIDEAIYYYKLTLRVPSLKLGEPAIITRKVPTGEINELFVLQGGFARVYKWKDYEGRARAVRCFFIAPPPKCRRATRRSTPSSASLCPRSRPSSASTGPA